MLRGLVQCLLGSNRDTPAADQAADDQVIVRRELEYALCVPLAGPCGRGRWQGVHVCLMGAMLRERRCASHLIQIS
jgi:hypothetical protein